MHPAQRENKQLTRGKMLYNKQLPLAYEVKSASCFFETENYTQCLVLSGFNWLQLLSLALNHFYTP